MLVKMILQLWQLLRAAVGYETGLCVELLANWPSLLVLVVTVALASTDLAIAVPPGTRVLQEGASYCASSCRLGVVTQGELLGGVPVLAVLRPLPLARGLAVGGGEVLELGRELCQLPFHGLLDRLEVEWGRGDERGPEPDDLHVGERDGLLLGPPCVLRDVLLEQP